MNRSFSEYIKIFFELGKVRITFFVAISTSVGYVLYRSELDWKMVIVGLSVFFLSVSSSALNHFQERKSDALMERTKNRPIPSGKIQPFSVLLFVSIVGLLGLAVLYLEGGTVSLLLGIFAFVWYNSFYTPLKQKYALAVVPGSLIGAIPPVIGWVSGGGSISDPQILAFALFFFIWQIPHFWLLLMIYGSDYKQAGFPTLTEVFSQGQLGRITYIWIIALSVSCLLIPLFSISKSYLTISLLLLASILLLVNTKKILSPIFEKKLFWNAFLSVNLFVLAVVAILSIDKLLL